MCVSLQLYVCVCVFGKGCQLLSVGGLYWMWQELPTEASSA